MCVYLVGYDKLQDSPSCAIASGDCNVPCSLRFHASPRPQPPYNHSQMQGFSPQLPICRLHVALRTRTLGYDKERSQKITSQLERYRPRTLDEQHRQHMSVLRSALWTLGRGCARAASERIPQHSILTPHSRPSEWGARSQKPPCPTKTIPGFNSGDCFGEKEGEYASLRNRKRTTVPP